jgi:carboxyl-terminal processing protease
MPRQLKYALFAAVLVILGMLAGFKLNRSYQGGGEDTDESLNKFRHALQFVEANYLEDPDQEKLVDDAIAGMLKGLDPHSFYIPTKEVLAMEEEMQGSFEGIGVEFNLVEDTIYVVTPISGGPSEQLGILAGDRIVKIDGKNVGGIGIENGDVTKYLRGPAGSKVTVEILRRGVKNLLKFEITRDKIPLYSVDYSYMVRDDVGYVKVSRFAEKTHEEFVQHVNKLKGQGMKSLILDLRGNPGGYMDMAERIADEFIAEGRRVVYTEGRMNNASTSYRSTKRYSLFEKGPLIVLMDYGSASASEIVAGAIQDWDRGLIVGVRSFGKGLVQTQEVFADTSAIRLVIAQYFTPSGRCIQKPYHMTSEAYENEILERMESGELYDETKIRQNDSLRFKTNAGRIVYGGGGIMPDVFVPRDTTGSSQYFLDLLSGDIFRQFCLSYGDKHPELKTQYPTGLAFCRKWRPSEGLIQEFTAFASTKNVKFDAEGFGTSRKLIENYLVSFVGRRLYGDDGFWPAVVEDDNVVQRALELLPAAAELEATGKFNSK